ncbi:MAG: hypothetical protein COV29_03165 [Candidatus Yanofskybacteria bacterium CG10_big_fil_rev_8_21_14_0_10_36_16]|uniref:VTT domain-containing protein n=1 Tax=Candidatus Yanofskybacteria bacterium CG10_big_fil_rev_8_21_14_0_10_36_16 TaxID=1975096 RepID=A0A2J0Q6Y3_9BACT|nr:MAG: hypothetical protein COV29_03165 [Candidatus Yanofskybacteria bacterium CG10_big_fil_rev_8_21_14_0_10_36_16]
MLFDIELLIKTVGLLGVVGIVFAESGLLVGFFLPGDGLLFTAGFLASQGFININLLAWLSFVAAVAGDSVGYYFGKRVGPLIFKKEESFWFSKDHLRTSNEFYKKHGGKTIIIARFMPFVRTFAPILAGVGEMKYSKFVFYNIAGGFLWTFGLSLGGYYMGNIIPNADKYILPIVLAIIVVSILPTAIHILKDPEHRRRLFAMFKK